MSTDLVAMTTFRQGSAENLIELVRAGVFLDTARNCRQLGIPLVVVYVDCSVAFLDELASLGATLVEQNCMGMGAIRRQAMQAAAENFAEAGNFLWLEPEKPGMPAIAQAVCADRTKHSPSATFFNRRSMSSYPPEQAHYYMFVRSVATKMLGLNIDYGFGPMLLTKRTMRFFLDYKSNHGDLWDSILVPRVGIIRAGSLFHIAEIDFVNDPRMTAIELGNPQIILKRLEQLKNVVTSLVAECQK